jgi:hypothetical protein
MEKIKSYVEKVIPPPKEIKPITSDIEEVKVIKRYDKRNIGGHHSANDGSFLASRAAKFGCMGKCGGKKK